MTSKSCLVLFILWTVGYVRDVASFIVPVFPTSKSSGAFPFLAQKISDARDDCSSSLPTPPSSGKFNFGPASARDNVLFTAERPGNPSIDDDKAGKEVVAVVADEQQVQDWLAFMKASGVTHVVALLDDEEFANCYAAPGLLQTYQSAGLTCSVQPMRDPRASQSIFAFLHTVEAQSSSSSGSGGGKVVAHCTGGIGRSSLVAAGWLVDR
jgi:hypothetical protein